MKTPVRLTSTLTKMEEEKKEITHDVIMVSSDTEKGEISDQPPDTDVVVVGESNPSPHITAIRRASNDQSFDLTAETGTGTQPSIPLPQPGAAGATTSTAKETETDQSGKLNWSEEVSMEEATDPTRIQSESKALKIQGILPDVLPLTDKEEEELLRGAEENDKQAGSGTSKVTTLDLPGGVQTLAPQDSIPWGTPETSGATVGATQLATTSTPGGVQQEPDEADDNVMDVTESNIKSEPQDSAAAIELGEAAEMKNDYWGEKKAQD